MLVCLTCAFKQQWLLFGLICPGLGEPLLGTIVVGRLTNHILAGADAACAARMLLLNIGPRTAIAKLCEDLQGPCQNRRHCRVCRLIGPSRRAALTTSSTVRTSKAMTDGGAYCAVSFALMRTSTRNNTFGSCGGKRTWCPQGSPTAASLLGRLLR